jgi:hypothetical protein
MATHTRSADWKTAPTHHVEAAGNPRPRSRVYFPPDRRLRRSSPTGAPSAPTDSGLPVATVVPLGSAAPKRSLRGCRCQWEG